MNDIKKSYAIVSELEDEADRLYEEMEACEFQEKKAELKKCFDEFMKSTFTPKVSKIFQQGPLTEELYHQIRESYGRVNYLSQQIEWLYSTSLYLGYEDLDEDGEFEEKEPPFSAEDILDFPQLAAVNASNNAYEQKQAMYEIVTNLESQISVELSEIDSLLHQK